MYTLQRGCLVNTVSWAANLCRPLAYKALLLIRSCTRVMGCYSPSPFRNTIWFMICILCRMFTLSSHLTACRFGNISKFLLLKEKTYHQISLQYIEKADTKFRCSSILIKCGLRHIHIHSQDFNAYVTKEYTLFCMRQVEFLFNFHFSSYLLLFPRGGRGRVRFLKYGIFIFLNRLSNMLICVNVIL